jgi:hypothetical protein
MSHNREKFIHSASEYAEYLAQQQKLHPISVTSVKPSAIFERKPETTRPRVRTPNENWAMEWPNKGFDEDQIRSYTVRRSDRLQAALFDRFVFGKGNCHEFGAANSSKGVAQRIVHNTKPFDSNSIKQRYRSFVDGGTSANPMKQEENRWRHARYRQA